VHPPIQNPRSAPGASCLDLSKVHALPPHSLSILLFIGISKKQLQASTKEVERRNVKS